MKRYLENLKRTADREQKNNWNEYTRLWGSLREPSILEKTRLMKGGRTGVQTAYKRQIPFLGKGEPNMEMEDDIKKLTERKMGQGKPKKLKLKKKEVMEGSTPIEEKFEEKLEGCGKSKLKRRAEKIKEIMKLKNISLIEASKYIKKNNIKY